MNLVQNSELTEVKGEQIRFKLAALASEDNASGSLIISECSSSNLSFANARTMKNLSRAIFETVILRLSKEQGQSAERVVLASDVESFVWKKISNKIGF